MKDKGIYIVTELGEFDYKENRVIFPENTETYKVFNPPDDINPFEF